MFSYAGDLWTASTLGGAAVRLTSHPGLELFGKFSPDGQHIAFTGQYGGDEQVYVMPAGGGAPKQLTFYPAPGPLADRWGFDNQVYGWTPDGAGILFRSARDGYMLTDSKLYTVPVDGRSGDCAADARFGRGPFLSGRETHRLLALVAGFSQRKTLSGRLGKRSLYLRSGSTRRSSR